MDTVAAKSPDNQAAFKSSRGFVGRSPMLAFAALIAVNAMWAFQFAGARIATRELGAVLVTLVPLAIATLLVLPFAGLTRDLFCKENRSVLLDVVLLGTLGVLP